MAVKVGFIGTGGISQAHRRHLKKMEDVEVVAMCDLVEEKVQEAAEEWGARVFTDYPTMLNEVEMDAVYVCIPPFAHENQEILAAEKGIALFVEKPVAVTMEKAREVNAAIQENGVISCAGFQGRYLDVIAKANEYRERKSITVITSEGSETTEVQNEYWQELDNAFIDAVRKGDGSELRSPVCRCTEDARSSNGGE